MTSTLNKKTTLVPSSKKLYTLKLTDIQMQRLDTWCREHVWSQYTVAHARFAYKGDTVGVVGYNTGKLVIQGKGVENFVTNVLEPHITQEVRMGYDAVLHPEWFQPHAGLDESGKGDLFGPLVSACVIADGPMVEQWIAAGIRDCKQISSEWALLNYAKIIQDTPGVVTTTTVLSMPKYNELYTKFGSNMNRLLGWMHAQSLKNALEKRSVEWGMLDQFSKAPIVQGYFKEASFDLKMQTHAESDPVVAAASIIARAAYIEHMRRLSETIDIKLQKGVNPKACGQMLDIVTKHGAQILPQYVKMHFKTVAELLVMHERTTKKLITHNPIPI